MIFYLRFKYTCHADVLSQILMMIFCCCCFFNWANLQIFKIQCIINLKVFILSIISLKKMKKLIGQSPGIVVHVYMCMNKYKHAIESKYINLVLHFLPQVCMLFP